MIYCTPELPHFVIIVALMIITTNRIMITRVLNEKISNSITCIVYMMKEKTKRRLERQCKKNDFESLWVVVLQLMMKVYVTNYESKCWYLCIQRSRKKNSCFIKFDSIRKENMPTYLSPLQSVYTQAIVVCAC